MENIPDNILLQPHRRFVTLENQDLISLIKSMKINLPDKTKIVNAYFYMGKVGLILANEEWEELKIEKQHLNPPPKPKPSPPATKCDACGQFKSL